MTVFVMKGDEQRCLDAGMDAYLSKPIHPAQLLGTIGRLVGPGQPADKGPKQDLAAKTSHRRIVEPAASRRATVEEGLAGCIDLTALLAQVEDDWELLAELVELFLESSPRLLEEAHAGLARGDWHAVERTAHALKGAMQNIAAVPAAELEEIRRAGDAARAAASLARLKVKFDELVEALEQGTIGGRS